jgi:hypothetical protein
VRRADVCLCCGAVCPALVGGVKGSVHTCACICVVVSAYHNPLLPGDANPLQRGPPAIPIGALAGTSPTSPPPCITPGHTSTAPLTPPALYMPPSLSPGWCGVWGVVGGWGGLMVQCVMRAEGKGLRVGLLCHHLCVMCCIGVCVV